MTGLSYTLKNFPKFVQAHRVEKGKKIIKLHLFFQRQERKLILRTIHFQNDNVGKNHFLSTFHEIYLHLVSNICIGTEWRFQRARIHAHSGEIL